MKVASPVLRRGRASNRSFLFGETDATVFVISVNSCASPFNTGIRMYAQPTRCTPPHLRQVSNLNHSLIRLPILINNLFLTHVHSTPVSRTADHVCRNRHGQHQENTNRYRLYTHWSKTYLHKYAQHHAECAECFDL